MVTRLSLGAGAGIDSFWEQEKLDLYLIFIRTGDVFLSDLISIYKVDI